MQFMCYYREAVDTLFKRSESWLPNEMLFLKRITQTIDEDNTKNDKNDLDENKGTYLSYIHICFSVLFLYYFCIISVFILL